MSKKSEYRGRTKGSRRRESDSLPAFTVGGETFYALPVEYAPDYAPDSVEELVENVLTEAQG